MGSNISLPALDVQPPRQQDPMEQASRMMAMRTMQQQQQMQGQDIQLRQMQLQDQQGMRQAYIDAQGDPQKFLSTLPKYNVSFDGMMKARQGVYQTQQQYMQMSNEQIAQAQKVTDILQGSHDRVAAAPPEQRPAVYQRELASLSRVRSE